MAPKPPVGQGSLFSRIITLRHTTLGRTSLDNRWGRRKDFYLTTLNTHKRKTSLPPAGFEPTIPASEQPQIHVLARVAILCSWLVNNVST